MIDEHRAQSPPMLVQRLPVVVSELVQSRVEPSKSVKSKVTTPVGRARTIATIIRRRRFAVQRTSAAAAFGSDDLLP